MADDHDSTAIISHGQCSSVSTSQNKILLKIFWQSWRTSRVVIVTMGPSLCCVILIWIHLALSSRTSSGFVAQRNLLQTQSLIVPHRSHRTQQHLGFRSNDEGDSFTQVFTMKASVYIAVTVDGFIATSDGDVSFLDRYQEDPGGSTAAEPKNNKYDFAAFLSTVDVLIMGRKTFEKVLSFGPEMWAYGTTRVVVLSRQPESVSIPSHLDQYVSCSSQQDPGALLSELSTQGFHHAYIDGGTTIQSFLRAGLIDQLILTRVPLLLGQGISLFSSDDDKPCELQHEETIDLGNGLVTSCYTIVKDNKNKTSS